MTQDPRRHPGGADHASVHSNAGLAAGSVIEMVAPPASDGRASILPPCNSTTILANASSMAALP
jgi:hypothetical protein